MTSVIRMTRQPGPDILLIEDMEDFQSTIPSILLRSGLVQSDGIAMARSLAEARAFLARFVPKAVVADYWLDDGCITALTELKSGRLGLRQHVGLVVQSADSRVVNSANLISVVHKPNTRCERAPFIDAVRGALARPLREHFDAYEIFLRLNKPNGPSQPSRPAMQRTGRHWPNKDLALASDVDIETARKVMAGGFRAMGTVSRRAMASGE